MRARILVVLLAAILLATASGSAQGFKPYPGATKLDKESAEATKLMPSAGEASVFTTSDSYDKVVAFYKASGKEYTLKGMSKVKLASGQEVQSTFFLFDGGTNLATSKCWAKVQRPYIGSVTMNGPSPEYHDIRDVTAILLTQKK